MARALIFLSLLLTVFSYPEVQKITGLPQQTQEIYQGWIFSSNDTNSNVFYQLYTANNTNVNNSKSTPVLIYLEGGPGDASTLTMFSEIGPYGVNSNFDINNPNLSSLNFSLFKRELTWTQKYHILSIDNPVNTGYSYSSPLKFVKTSLEAAGQLMNFLARFYQIFTSLQSNPLYIVGRSYGGHWCPALAYLIVKQNYTIGKVKVNLGGIISADGMVNLANQTRYSEIMYSAGITDQFHYDLERSYDLQLMQIAWARDYVSASYGFGQLQYAIAKINSPDIYINNMRQYLVPGQSYSEEIVNALVSPQLYLQIPWTNISTARVQFNIPLEIPFLNGYLNTTLAFFDSGDLADDLTPLLNYLLNNNVRVCLFVGQDDLNLGPFGTRQLLNGLSWPGIKNYTKSPQGILHDYSGKVIGNYKAYKNLAYATIFKAGHLASLDQPASVMKLLDDFISGSWS